MISMTSTRSTPKPAGRMLLLLVAVFALPFLIGSGLFWSGWRPDKSGNHGELLQPPRSLPANGLQHVDGRALSSTELHGKWLLVLPLDGECQAACLKNLQQMQQVHMALTKGQNRLQRVLVRSGVSEPAAALQGRFPDLLVGIVQAGPAGLAWQHALDGAGQGVYIVDPLGNVVLRYAAPVEMRGVLKDIERLLKYSWIG
ncbi:MAG: hypothetical protein H6R07_1223 [Proteobacteria bacterium]|nr:hypothetical protein [Pseudomonadota bacterium]